MPSQSAASERLVGAELGRSATQGRAWDQGQTTRPRRRAACRQVLAETGNSKAVAFDEIDKAPEEKARGITIATAHGERQQGPRQADRCTRHCPRAVPQRGLLTNYACPLLPWPQWSTRLRHGTMPTSTALVTPTMLRT